MQASQDEDRARPRESQAPGSGGLHQSPGGVEGSILLCHPGWIEPAGWAKKVSFTREYYEKDKSVVYGLLSFPEVQLSKTARQHLLQGSSFVGILSVDTYFMVAYRADHQEVRIPRPLTLVHAKKKGSDWDPRVSLQSVVFLRPITPITDSEMGLGIYVEAANRALSRLTEL